MKRYVTVGIIYVVLLAIILTISWLAFPAWSQRQGGFWELLGIAAAADLVFVTGVVALWEKLKKDKNGENTASTPNPPQPVAPLQHVEEQEAEHLYNAPGGEIHVHHAPQQQNEEPEPPKGWNLKHRYALTGNFTGRETELKTLTEWLEEKEEPLFILRALGGFGKSALTWHWLLNHVDRAKWTKALWWSFYEGDASFQNFLHDTLTYLLGENAELPSAPRLQVETLLKALEEEGILLILDGFERALRAYSGMNAAYQEDIEDESPLPEGEGQGEGEKQEDARRRDCVSPAADDFLRGLASLKGIIQAKVLMTTRLRPRAVEGRNSLLGGCLEKELKKLSKEDAVTLFQNQGIKGTRAEIEATCAPYGYHPLTLSILAGYILGNRSKPNDVAVAKELDITEDIIQNKHHVLKVAYNSLAPEEQMLLSTIACFRSPTSYEALEAITEGKGGSQTRPNAELDDQLKQLEIRGLLHWDKTENKYDLHPIVRRYAYERLTAPDRTAAHSRLRDYFAAVPQPEKIENLNDLAPIIELYHHMVRAGQFDEARIMFRDRLNQATYFQFGAYQLRIELMRVLFIDGEHKPPHLKDESAQAWTINGLANSYALNGQPRRAVLLFEMHNEIREKAGDKRNLVVGLGNIADMVQIHIGMLGDAERNLRHSIDICREIEDEFREAAIHQFLGRVLAYRGLWADAKQELANSTKYWKKSNHIQGHGVDERIRSLRALLMARNTDDTKLKTEYFLQATEFAQRALKLTNEQVKYFPVERDFIISHWLLGTSLRISSKLEDAEKHFSESLRRCRAINLVDHEANVLLEVSKLRQGQGAHKEALKLAQEALIITERSGYVLQGADVNIWLATLAMEGLRLEVEGDELSDKELAKKYAEAALKLAHCDDGPPYHYKVAYEEAERLLAQLEK